MAIEHASMLMQNHRSIGAMSIQGFEASHKVHRQLYLRATSHDVSEGFSSGKEPKIPLKTKWLIN